jgi:hypothetical protein
MEDFNQTFDKISVKYDNVILIGDLNYNVLDEDKGTPLTTMCDIFDYTNLVKTATCQPSPTLYKPAIHLHVNFCLLSRDGNCQLQTDYL